MTEAQARLEEVFRAEHGRVVAAVVRRFGDLDLAEDAVAEAIVDAIRSWPDAGVPPNPAAWLTTTAHSRALDLIRSRDSRARREAQAYADTPPSEPIGEVGDDRLRLMFMCCHPVLDPAARVALTLRLVAGAGRPERRGHPARADAGRTDAAGPGIDAVADVARGAGVARPDAAHAGPPDSTVRR